MDRQPGKERSTSQRLQTIKLAHLSDIHFGKISHPAIVDVLVDEVNDANMDVVVVSGDLTQRAHDHQYEAAVEMLDRFQAPVLVVPGNHDVRQFWHNPFERFFKPTSRYERFFPGGLTPTYSTDGVSLFGLNSAHGRTVKGGRIHTRDIETMRTYFSEQPTGNFRVLVVHHHLIRNSAFGRTDISRNARLAWQTAIESQVDLILCGHYHISRVTAFPALNGRQIVVASAGTATSSRGRDEDQSINMYNWVTVHASSYKIQERQFDPVKTEYHQVRVNEFSRQAISE